jgi:hypothetical protein
VSGKPVVLRIDKPHFTIKLYENMLKIDLKKTLRNEIEEAFDKTPISSLFEVFVPLHIRLSRIDSVRIIDSGKVKLTLRHRRDVVLPLAPDEAKELVDKLNDLIPLANEKEIEALAQHIEAKKESQKRLFGDSFDNLETGVVAARSRLLAVYMTEINAEKERTQRREEEEED